MPVCPKEKLRVELEWDVAGRFTGKRLIMPKSAFGKEKTVGGSQVRKSRDIESESAVVDDLELLVGEETGVHCEVHNVKIVGSLKRRDI